MPLTIRRVAPLIGSVALVATLATTGAPEATAAPPFTPETLSVAANSIQGVDTSQSLQAGSLYRAVAWGTFSFGRFQTGDAECTEDKSRYNPLRGIEPPAASWLRHRFMFVGSLDPTVPDDNTILNNDLRDPEPTDDPIDLYVENRNVEWIPVGVSKDNAPAPLGCHHSDPDQTPHVYEVYFTPLRTGPVNFRIFDIYYGDNDASTLTVLVQEVGQSGVSLGRHVETVLVSAESGTPARSAALTWGRRYALVAHGIWTYHGLFDLADAECTRTTADPVYRRSQSFWQQIPAHGDLTINSQDIDWVPLVPAQVGVRTRPSGHPTTVELDENCDGIGHFYRTEVTGDGQPLDFLLVDPVGNRDFNTGHLRVEIYEIDPRP